MEQMSKSQDITETKEAVEKLANSVKAEILKDGMTFNMIYQMGYNDGLKAGRAAV